MSKLDDLIRALQEVKPGEIEPALFNALARLTTSIAFEAVWLRIGSNGIPEVFMTQRGSDEAYPGLWHCPGSIFRPGEQPEDVLKRLSAREFGTEMCIVAPGLCNERFDQEKRGWFLFRVYRVKGRGRPTKPGTWWPVNALHADTVEHHREFIVPAVLRFLGYNQPQS